MAAENKSPGFLMIFERYESQWKPGADKAAAYKFLIRFTKITEEIEFPHQRDHNCNKKYKQDNSQNRREKVYCKYTN